MPPEPVTIRLMRIVLIVLLLQLVFALAMSYYDRQVSLLLTAINFLALGVLVVTISLVLKRVNNGLASLFFMLVLLLLAVIYGLKVMLLAFSGKGFTPEVFFHLEPTSFAVGWAEFSGSLIIFSVLLGAILAYLAHQFHKPVDRSSKIPGLLPMVLVAIAAFSLTRTLSPPLQAWEGWLEYNAYVVPQTAFNASEFQPFLAAGIVNSLDVLNTGQLQVRPGAQARNLIMIYLESFNWGLTTHPKYPDLTPFINSLQKQHPDTSRHYTSSYVTIESIVSSQCGTLLPMFRGNDSLMESRGIMPAMACLGDVLEKAGYEQYFFGGANLIFAGKGAFLKAHGYQNVFGWADWYARREHYETGVWGLSDPNLFDEAVDTIREAHKKPPFNVTILTLGTHLPGFVYQRCKPYRDQAPQFVNAVHCTDQSLEKFITDLQRENLLDNTLVFIMGDHGVFPTREMYAAFGAMVDDHRLLTIAFPAPQLPDDWRMSTYDTAPTLLDLLGIEHNQKFLYGRSALADEAPRPFVTRYFDWVNGRQLPGREGGCEQMINMLYEPLTGCMKNKLLKLTQSKLDGYSSRPVGKLSCIFSDFIRISRAAGEENFELVVAGRKALKSFTREGYFITATGPGFYLLELNVNNDILARNYYDLSSGDLDRLARRLLDWPDANRMLLVYLTGNEPLPARVRAHLLKHNIVASRSFVYVSARENRQAFLQEFELKYLPFSIGSETCRQVLAPDPNPSFALFRQRNAILDQSPVGMQESAP